MRRPKSAELRSDGASLTSGTPSSLVVLKTCRPAVQPLLPVPPVLPVDVPELVPELVPVDVPDVVR